MSISGLQQIKLEVDRKLEKSIMPVISFKLRGENMIGRSWKILNILFLLIFLLLSTCIGLLHTENPLGYDPLCPACRFQHSTLATAQIDVVQLPTAVVLETVQTPLSRSLQPAPHR